MKFEHVGNNKNEHPSKLIFFRVMLDRIKKFSAYLKLKNFRKKRNKEKLKE